MGIRYYGCSVFNVSAQVIINTVNCKGVMGKGLALSCKKRFPAMYEEYRAICLRGEFRPGKLHLWKHPHQWILNFPTKDEWWDNSQLSWIESGLENLARNYQAMGITSINVPPLGCANGGLKFDDVRPLIERYLGNLPGLQVNVCVPEMR